MMIWIEKYLGVHVADQLDEHGCVQLLTQNGDDGNCFLVPVYYNYFIKTNNRCYFPYGGKFVSLHIEVENVSDRRYNHLLIKPHYITK